MGAASILITVMACQPSIRQVFLLKACRSCSSQICPSPASSSNRSRISQEPEKKHIHLVGIPRSATPADVMRLARQTIKDDGLVKNIGQGVFLSFQPYTKNLTRMYVMILQPDLTTTVSYPRGEPTLH